MKNLLYISNWPFKEGLTQATVLPHLSILQQGSWDRVFYSSLEMTAQEPAFNGPAIKHLPFYMKEHPVRLWDRLLRWKRYTRVLKSLIEQENISCLLARGSAAGIIAARLGHACSLPFYVESFEPHAAYMLHAGVWKSLDPRYIVQQRGEQLIKKTASGLMPVSNYYRSALIKEGIDEKKIQVVPCAVPVERFAFRQAGRDRIRQELSLGAASFVGIYVGKLGGLYYDREAMNLWATCFRIWPDFQLIWLTPQNSRELENLISDFHDLPFDRLHIRSVPHEQVPDYLSAADFAFSLHRSTVVSPYFSPIKDGEYWANGLPIVISEGVGDDANIIQEQQCGLVLPADWPSKNIDEMLKSGRRQLVRKSFIQDIAAHNRSFLVTKKAYEYFGID